MKRVNTRGKASAGIPPVTRPKDRRAQKPDIPARLRIDYGALILPDDIVNHVLDQVGDSLPGQDR